MSVEIVIWLGLKTTVDARDHIRSPLHCLDVPGLCASGSEMQGLICWHFVMEPIEQHC